jgi:hypothetical protein
MRPPSLLRHHGLQHHHHVGAPAVTRSRLTVVDITDRDDGTHEVLWSNGRRTVANAEELRDIQFREAKAKRTPLDAA